MPAQNIVKLYSIIIWSVNHDLGKLSAAYKNGVEKWKSESYLHGSTWQFLQLQISSSGEDDLK